ncbi:MAG: hypothetical protein HGB19_12520 [Chlorobiales bacterium]|nr:hypothetical protein [Chlorobiales bacterium]
MSQVIDFNAQPIFKVLEIVPGGIGRTWKIWADGRTEGFDCRHAVTNLIGVMADYQTAIALEKAQEERSSPHETQ